ncbi:hypothetical protein E2C01_076200 [Portunus trituberculatus]|uniref:Uncharacterized protein n=1 Tax=Portunus trituberculatus TaxID=210409 RepID=A0A5B7IH78_PORTR|nr:hypothetical protein [Portunus trituberculatus]
MYKLVVPQCTPRLWIPVGLQGAVHHSAGNTRISVTRDDLAMANTTESRNSCCPFRAIQHRMERHTRQQLVSRSFTLVCSGGPETNTCKDFYHFPSHKDRHSQAKRLVRQCPCAYTACSTSCPGFKCNSPRSSPGHPAILPHYGASSELIDRSSGRTETRTHSTHRGKRGHNPSSYIPYLFTTR